MPRRHRSHSTEFKRQVVAEYTIEKDQFSTLDLCSSLAQHHAIQ